MRLHIRLLENQQIEGFSPELIRRDYVRIVSEWCMISLITVWLMYDRWILFCFLLPGIYFWIPFRKEMVVQKYKREYAAQFGEGLTTLASAVSAGFSLESAITEALKDLRSIHGKDNEMMKELERMSVQISMNRNIEELFFEMADRSGLDDAVSLADVLRAARRNGGNLSEIMEDAAGILQEKEAVNREIEVLLAGKRYEQKLMCMIPFGMVLYLRLGSPGYLDALYHSFAGVSVMTVCLILYGIAVYMGSKVLKIEV